MLPDVYEASVHQAKSYTLGHGLFMLEVRM